MIVRIKKINDSEFLWGIQIYIYNISTYLWWNTYTNYVKSSMAEVPADFITIIIFKIIYYTNFHDILLTFTSIPWYLYKENFEQFVLLVIVRALIIIVICILRNIKKIII